MKTTNGQLPDLPASNEEIARQIPAGWTYLGARETPAGCRWEAASPAGVASAPSPGKLLHMVQQAELIKQGAAVSNAEAVEGSFNRRRKSIRRADRESTLERCLTCQALVFGDKKSEHPCAGGFSFPSCKDDGTGDDLTLDDPAVAMAVIADD